MLWTEPDISFRQIFTIRTERRIRIQKYFLNSEAGQNYSQKFEPNRLSDGWTTHLRNLTTIWKLFQMNSDFGQLSVSQPFIVRGIRKYWIKAFLFWIIIQLLTLNLVFLGSTYSPRITKNILASINGTERSPLFISLVGGC